MAISTAFCRLCQLINDAPDPVQRGYVVFLHIPPDALYDLHRGIRVMEVRRPHRDCGSPGHDELQGILKGGDAAHADHRHVNSPAHLIDHP